MNNTFRSRSVFSKIFISYLFLIIVIISGLLLFLNRYLGNVYIKNVETNLLHICAVLEDDIMKTDPSHIQSVITSLSDSIGDRITVINTDGKVVADSFVADTDGMENHYYRPELQEARENGTGSSLRFSTSVNSRMLYVAKKISDGKMYIRLSRPVTDIEAILYNINGTVMTVGVLFFIFSLLMNVFISRKFSLPILKTMEFAENFASGDFSGRMTDFRDDEIGILQRSLNRLADNLEKYIHNLTVEQKKLAITLETISDPIIVIDNEGTIIISNRAFRSLYNLDVISSGRKYYEIIRGTKLNKIISSSLKTQTDESLEHKFSDDKVFDVFISTINQNDAIDGMLIVFHDISEKKQVERMKTDLVGNLSHELKTPIAIIKGYLETIQINPENTEMRKEFILKSIAGLDRQNAIINDMLKLNMLETKGIFENEDIDIIESVENCLASLTPKIIKKKMTVEKYFDKTCRTIPANKFLTEQIIFNIVDNAINYSSENGKIIITTFKETDNDILNLVFEDNGIGIPENAIDKIFERFFRVDKGRSRSTGGTGLGLSIVKHSAELQKWEIRTQSLSSGINGTRFTFLIPLNELLKH